MALLFCLMRQRFGFIDSISFLFQTFYTHHGGRVNSVGTSAEGDTRGSSFHLYTRNYKLFGSTFCSHISAGSTGTDG
jgi:hypothetical protein